jgi:transcriptional regulator with XRE-family HTH domain
MDGMVDALGTVGARLRALRTERGTTLAQVAEATGISVSTLSRLESGGRKPTLELLLPLARVHQVSLDELVDAPPTGDPRVRMRPVVRDGLTYLPLTQRPGAPAAYKVIMPPHWHADEPEPEPRTHEGYEWLYVLSGRLRLVLGTHDMVLTAGEAAEFDTRQPHWFDNPSDQPAEVLMLFGPQGERAHVRIRPTRTAPASAQRRR